MFTAFITAFCTGCIILGVLYILVPEGHLSKAASYAFSLAFLCLVLSVSVKMKNIDLPDFGVSENDFSDERLSAVSARMVFAQALRDEKINFSEITVFTDKTKPGGISITKVYVYTDASPESVYSVIGSDNYEVVVINE